MPTLLQTAGGKALNSTFVDAPFTAANTAHTLLAVATLWFDRSATPGSQPSITISDTLGQSYFTMLSEWYGGGGNLMLQVNYILDCGAGSNTVRATASRAGVMMIAVHEVQADAGQIWQADNWGFGTNTSTPSLQLFGNSPAFSNDYNFMCFGVDNQNFLAYVASPVTGFTNRQYIANSTPIDSGATTTGGAELFWYGSLCTWDGHNLGNSGGGAFELAFPTSNIYASLAICCSFASIVPSCHSPVATPPSGTYVGTQSVTLTQDQGKPMYYTLDGSYPTTSSTLYTGAISVTTALRLNVLAHDPSSALADTVVGFNYTITPNPPPNSTITITWERRTRIGGAWSDGTPTVPLSEQSEKYDLEIWSDDGTVLIRTVAGLTTNSFVYTPAMQFTDFNAYKAFVFVRVYQLSDIVGRGFVAVNPKVGLGGQTPGGGSDATSILGAAIMGSPGDGDILRYSVSTGTWNIVGPALKRQTLTKVSGSLANNAAETGVMAVNCGMFGLIKIHVDRNCRVQLYSTAAFRDADVSRGYDVQPAVGVETGIIADFGFDSGGNQSWVCSPALIGANVDSSPIQSIYYRITNLSGSTHTVTVDLTLVPLEILP